MEKLDEESSVYRERERKCEVLIGGTERIISNVGFEQ